MCTLSCIGSRGGNIEVLETAEKERKRRTELDTDGLIDLAPVGGLLALRA